MLTAKDHAIDLYMSGIRDGDARGALERNTGLRYTQHSTGVKDGRDGFLEFFEPFLERNPVREMSILHALQDGDKVFVHVHQSLNNGEAQWVTGDFFDTDGDGKIVEHWDVIAAAEPAGAEGHSMIDGVSEITDRDLTDTNRARVKAYVSECLIGGDAASRAQYVSADIVDHSAESAQTPAYQECFHIVAEGNFVATMNRAQVDGSDMCHIDLFRLADGVVVEQWALTEPVPPQAEWANSGKF